MIYVEKTPANKEGNGRVHTLRNLGLAALFVAGVTVGAFGYRSYESHTSPAFVTSVAGEVVCPAGERVVGIYVRPDGSAGDFIKRESTPGQSNTANFGVGFYKNVGAYTISVGCGGTGTNWAHNDKAPLTAVSIGPVRVVCSDQPNLPGNNGTLNGSCTVGPLVQPNATTTQNP